jgi:amino-acid N-acetyltransferase
MTSPTANGFAIRAARASDVRSIQVLREPNEGKVLLHHDLVALFEKVQEFSVVEDSAGKVVAAGAVHIMWEDLAEVRSIVVASDVRGRGVGHALVEALLLRASALGVQRVFCLTFEVGFFESLGFEQISNVPIDPATFEQMSLSADDGVAEFLDLARVKENTLGNTRMLKRL